MDNFEDREQFTILVCNGVTVLGSRATLLLR
jgi:hypothetical protein